MWYFGAGPLGCAPPPHFITPAEVAASLTTQTVSVHAMSKRHSIIIEEADERAHMTCHVWEMGLFRWAPAVKLKPRLPRQMKYVGYACPGKLMKTKQSQAATEPVGRNVPGDN